MTFTVEHVTSSKREKVTEEQWKQMNKLFPGMFRKVQPPKRDALSDEAKKIIAESVLNG